MRAVWLGRSSEMYKCRLRLQISLAPMGATGHADTSSSGEDERKSGGSVMSAPQLPWQPVLPSKISETVQLHTAHKKVTRSRFLPGCLQPRGWPKQACIVFVGRKCSGGPSRIVYRLDTLGGVREPHSMAGCGRCLSSLSQYCVVEMVAERSGRRR